MTQPTNADTTGITNVPDVGGSQIVNDQYTNYVNYLNALTGAQQVANNYAISKAQVAQSYAQVQEQAQAAQAQFAVNMAQAQAEYQNNVAQFGLSKAQDIYNANVQQAQLALQSAQAQQQNAAFQLSQSQANAQQRTDQQSAYQGVMNMLAARTGPQDEVAYQRLISGLGAPTPTNSTTINPFQYVQDMYQPSNIASPTIPGAPTNLAASFNGTSMPGMTWPSYPAGGDYAAPSITNPENFYNAPPATTVSSPTSASTATPINKPPAGTSPSADIPGTTIPYSAVFTNTPGEPATDMGTPINKPPAGTPTTADIPGSTIPYGAVFTAPRMADGGVAANPATAIVGDGHGARPLPTSEIAQAFIDPSTGRPALRVIPADIARDIINRASIPRADSGGTYGTALNSNMLTYNSYGPGVMGSQPFYQQLTGAMPSQPFGAFGATISNPELGISNAPMNVNLRTYNYLQPSQQAGFQSLYGQGLAINPQDVIAQAQQAAPTGDYYGYTPLLASRYGG